MSATFTDADVRDKLRDRLRLLAERIARAHAHGANGQIHVTFTDHDDVIAACVVVGRCYIDEPPEESGPFQRIGQLG
jgi:hypothetical protein